MSDTPRVPGPMYVNRTDRELGVTGIQTFMKLPVCLTADDLRVGEMDVAVPAVPGDGTVTARSGTPLGPQAIRACDYIGGYGMSLPHLDVRVDPLEHLKGWGFGASDILPGGTDAKFTAM